MHELTVSSDPESYWLYEAALAEASNLRPIAVFGASFDRELVLVRYTSQLQSGGFKFAAVKQFGAMWCNRVTCDFDKTARITGANRGVSWKGMNVVRLGVPSHLQIPGEMEAAPIRFGPTQWGSEYWLSFDIPNESFAIIPFGFDLINRRYLKASYYTAPTHAHEGQLQSL